ncbi:cellulase family glycosylhydrolase [uncultured Aquimarina sp.]|uniref:cellulase family glycosylhydrolase n=1 Tax=uncultured Aquimarina sp. TaxID=575652 RepID=UPI002606D041|nr:cellulase family glycosylhydrolase [uncultured Aquimarina sp.]
MKKLYLLLVVIILFVTDQMMAQTIVERHGQLKVEGGKIKDKCNRNTQLKGMSYFWHQWEGSEYWNGNIVKWLRDDWKVEIVRAAMGVRGSGGDYIDDPIGSVNKVRAVVDAAIEHGIYVIIDFHAHPNYKNQAKTFFRQMSQEYGAYPNIIYEIWNEPIGDYGNSVGTWNEIKSYAREVIAEIRANDPNNIIVVGTPFYSQRVDTAADNPLTTDINNNPVKNIAYTIHAYAGAHRQSLRDKGDYAMSKGLALFMTECGRVGTNYGPNNNLDAAEWNRWEQWMDDNDISYCKWSLSNKNEVSSSLRTSASPNGNWNYNNDLTAEGRWNRDHFRQINTPPTSCDDTGGTQEDKIKALVAPDEVQRGSEVVIEVDYSSSTERDIVVLFQQNTSPWTVYGSKKIKVNKGTAKIQISVPIDNNTPIANDQYQFQSYITTVGGNWSSRLDNLNKPNIDCIPQGNQGEQITIRAKGSCGSETMILEVNGVNVKTWANIGTTAQDYQYNDYSGGTVKVKFTNDGLSNGCDKNIFVDYVLLQGVTYQTEDYASRTGCGDQQWLWCNGNFDFGTFSNGTDEQQNGIIEVGAKGNCGGEKIQLLLDGKKVSEWSLTTNISVYTFQGYSNNENIKIAFVNDGNSNSCDKNAYVDWIKVCENRYQTESIATRTGCGNSEWLFCNGNFDYGSPNCDNKTPELTNENTIVVYPNPVTNGQVTINAVGEYNVTIYNMVGKKVYEKNTSTDTLVVSTDHLTNGLYILKFYNYKTKKEHSQKLIIK